MGALLSTARVAPLPPAAGELLGEACVAGGRFCARLAGVGPEEMRAMEPLARAFYRRWMLELLLVLRRGTLGFNALSRELGGLAGQSLSAKLREAAGLGLVDKTGGGAYSLTPRGAAVSACVLALTSGKALHARSLREGFSLPPIPQLRRVSLDPAGTLEAEARAFAGACAAFARQVDATIADGAHEDALTTARRFTEACVHKWHGAVLLALALRGPLRFGDLKQGVGAGDEALSRALASLERLGSIERAGGRWGATAAGRFDLSLGVPIPALLHVP